MTDVDDIALRLARQRASVDRRLRQLKISYEATERELKDEKTTLDIAISEFVKQHGPYMTLAGELGNGNSESTAVEDDEALLNWAIDNLMEAVKMTTSVTALEKAGCEFVPDPNGPGKVLQFEGEQVPGVYRLKTKVAKFKANKNYVEENDEY